jgi:ORF6N domain
MGKELARRRPSPAQKPVEERIRVIRGKQVVLDSDLAAFSGVETRRLTEQMKRNQERFPEDFVFQLSEDETDALRSQDAISKPGRGGRRYRPYAFTEQGALQVSGVLRTAKAAEVSVAVARAFVVMRTQLHAPEDLPTTIADIQNKLDELEASDADLNAKVETMAEGLKAIRQALKALNRAED